MNSFTIDADAIGEASARARDRAAAGEGEALGGRLAAGELLAPEDLAVLLHADDVSTESLLQLAADRRAPDGTALETFSPLYLSNECDAECLMCGMRSGNRELLRETADASTTRAQLDILHRRGMRGVALLTGEYHRSAKRDAMLARTARALGDALERGFTHVLINVGSLERSEYAPLLEAVPRADDGGLRSHVTMCTFQESYDPRVYARFMGTSAENPRSDFDRRLQNFDRAADAGMRSANPGLLLGLNRDVGYEVIALASHVEYMLARGLFVYISLPRLRKASGAEHRAGLTDDELARVVSVFSARFTRSRVVISTREAPEMQQRLLPAIGVLTAGSPGVAPYQEASTRFDIDASQFEVADQRPFEVILGECLASGHAIDGYEPASDRIG
jgi:2-iminoacetate synthase